MLLANYGSAQALSLRPLFYLQVQAALAEDIRRLRSTFLEVLLSRAPSARS